MDVSQKQLDEWREVMRRVCVGSVEIQTAISAHNRPRANLLLGSLGAAASRCAGQMDRVGAQVRSPTVLAADGMHDTPANRRFLDALRRALYAAREVDAERRGTETPAADLVQMLMAEVTREIFGPPVRSASLFDESEIDLC